MKSSRKEFEEFLKNFGFTKHGKNLALCGDFCCVIVNFQGSSYGGYYYVNVGIHVKSLSRVLPEGPNIFHLTGDLISLLPNYSDYNAFDVSRLANDSNLDEQFHIMLERVKNRIMFLLKDIHSKDELTRFIESEESKHFSVSAELQKWLSE